MADTMRSVAAALALLADNTAGNISAQDMRDVFVTLQPGHAEITVTTPAATSFSDTTSYGDVAGTWTLSADSHNWDMNTNGQLRYTGAADRVAHIAASTSLTSSNNNQTVHVAVGKNGTVITESVIQRKIATGADVGAAAAHAFVAVSNGDYLTIMLRNTSWSASETVTLETGNLFAMDMPT